MLDPIVPAGLFVLVSGRVLTLELNPFAVRNTNPISHNHPILDIFHYSSDIVEGQCWVCTKQRYLPMREGEEIFQAKYTCYMVPGSTIMIYQCVL